MLVGGVIAGIIARFPPLLRIEIVRDFFQIAGLFFDGLYDPVLEFFRDYHPPVGATAVAYVSEVVDTSPNAVTHVNRFMGFVVVVHWVNMVAMLVALAFGVSALRVQLKRLTGWLSFSDTSRGIDDGRAKTIIPYWDIAKEAKHRVWQAFWRAILLELAVPTSSDDVSNQKWKGGGSKDVSVKGTDRLASLEEAVVASGLKRVESHWFGTEHVYTTQLRRLAREALEGVDVYWNNPFGARDGHLDSVTCFGKITRIMADGFNVTMKYKDGTGVVEIPDSDYRIKVKGPRKALMKADHIGLKPTMEESETLSMIFKATESVWKSGLKELREKHRKYRHELIAKHENENAALSDTFWFFVYYNPHLARNKLETYLREHETNPLLQNLPKKHKLALDALYLRQKWVYLNPRQTCWYVFWDDVYARNSGMKKYLKREDFDPLLPTSICYMPPMEKKDLENWLAQRKLLGRWKSFHPDLINMLYDKMSAYEKKLKEDRKQLMKRLLVQSIRRLDEK
ncbi:Cyclin-dependent kinase E-1 [Phytophthora nicotianae]|uniref:Cyclin-dependent kinase E-1 n=1 Tax=Phytophthora nicotianae TaxID=4792 RepID=A0A0W8CTM4_PHYNI|nr:Cyclin-dependent kinase E-1 [Phytophthora nicotianae]